MNTFQKMIGVLLLIVSLSVAYYFLKYIPNKELRLLQKECFELGQKLYNQEKTEDKNNKIIHVFRIQPKYKYYRGMKTCIYSGGYQVLSEIATTYLYIKNAYTNEVIKEVTIDSNKGNDPKQTKQKEEFFNYQKSLTNNN